MRVLQVNKFHYLFGGADRYYFDVSRLLQRHGHEVAHFSTLSSRNEASPYSAYFPPNVDFRRPGLLAKAAFVGRMFGVGTGKLELARLLDTFQPDIVHAHNVYHQLSPVLFEVVKHAGIPLVLTAHDYKAVCANYKLYNPRTGRICERCVGRGVHYPLLERCMDGSRLMGGLMALEQRRDRPRLIELPDRLLAPSRFMAERLLRGGAEPQSVQHLPYFLWDEDFPSLQEEQDYLLYLGRLTEEKGLDVLLDAAARRPEVRVLIAGAGPEEQRLRRRAAELPNVEFVGWVDRVGARQLLQQARALIVPSVWPDNSPLVIYEALAAGRPVVASSVGGIPELVRHGETGLLVPARDVQALADAFARLVSQPAERRALGMAGRELMWEEYREGSHQEAIYKTYSALLTRSG